MKDYTYKTEENNLLVREAMKEIELFMDKGCIDSDDIGPWLESYADLNEKCFEDRYFNSCYKGFPCMHTDENIEYQFSMFYYQIENLKECFELNFNCMDILIRLLKSDARSGDENEIYDELSLRSKAITPNFHGNSWDEYPDIFKYPMTLNYFDYSYLPVCKSELINLYRIDRVYYS